MKLADVAFVLILFIFLASGIAFSKAIPLSVIYLSSFFKSGTFEKGPGGAFALAITLVGAVSLVLILFSSLALLYEKKIPATFKAVIFLLVSFIMIFNTYQIFK